MPTKTNIHLYTAGTPNGYKVSILLEELGLEYKVRGVDPPIPIMPHAEEHVKLIVCKTTAISLQKNTQKEPWFLEINPNGRIPAITDTFDDGQPIRIFESGSILQYLVDRYDKDHKVSYPYGSREYWEVNNWLHWQMGGLGPMQGQANHFKRYAPEQIQYGIDRYTNETRRLYRVLETQLEKSTSGFLVGDRLTIADISSVGWVNSHAWAGVPLDEFPKLAQWLENLRAREGVKKGLDVPEPRNTKPLTDAEAEKIAAEARAWVQQGMAEDAKK